MNKKPRRCVLCKRTENKTRFSSKGMTWCAECNRDYVFKRYWRTKIKEEGREVLEEQLKVYARRMFLLTSLLDETDEEDDRETG